MDTSCEGIKPYHIHREKLIIFLKDTHTHTHACECAQCNIHWEFNRCFIICYISFHTTNSPAFIPFPFLFYMLSNDMLRPRVSAISHEQHKKVVNHKPSPLQNITDFTYPLQNLISSHRIDMLHWKNDCLLVCDLLLNLCSCSVLTLNNSLLQ